MPWTIMTGFGAKKEKNIAKKKKKNEGKPHLEVCRTASKTWKEKKGRSPIAKGKTKVFGGSTGAPTEKKLNLKKKKRKPRKVVKAKREKSTRSTQHARKKGKRGAS